MSTYARERAQQRIAGLAGQGLDAATFFREVGEIVEAAVPSYGTPGWYTLDPASLLITSYYNDERPEIEQRLLQWEYFVDDVNKAADVARSTGGISTLHEAAGGDPRHTYTYDCLQQYGLGQEVRVALRTRSGDAWGLMSLVREEGRPQFDADELGFLRSLSGDLALGAKRGLLVGDATDPDWPGAPGLVVLGDDGGVESLTPGVERLLAELPGGGRDTGELPASVVAVAGQALRTADHPDAASELAVARVLSNEGRWIVLHGAALVAAGRRRAAVIVEPAHPARISPLLMAAYGLTEREQEVTRLVLRGDSTKQIAQALFVSPHTVQQHLTNIFEKTGVRSRRDLVGRVFFAHYEPRVRDNERRGADGQPMRGGPFPLPPARGVRSPAHSSVVSSTESNEIANRQ